MKSAPPQWTVNEKQHICAESKQTQQLGAIGQIIQVDGLEDSIDDENQTDQIKDIFAINCENNDIVQMISFFRSFQFLWLSFDKHSLCAVEDSCFFCNIRSSILRVNETRVKGPLSLKIYEFISQVGKYEEFFNSILINNLLNIEECIEWTLKLISQKESLQVYLTSYQKSTEKDRYNYESRFIKHIDLGSSISNEVISISGLLEKYIDDINRKLDKYDTKLGMNDFAGKFQRNISNVVISRERFHFKS